MPVRAVIFDFNGTLSDDEPILCEIFSELFAEHGRPLSAQEYYDELAGLSDPEIVRTWLGRDHPDVDAVIARARSSATARRSPTARPCTSTCARRCATPPTRVPVAIVSGAARAEIEPVVEAAGLAAVFAAIVAADDVADGKPHPEGYLQAARAARRVEAAEAVVFEDTEAGIASAKAAGMRCIAVRGTLAPERLARGGRARRPRSTSTLMQRLLG